MLWTLTGFGLGAILRTDRSTPRPAVIPDELSRQFELATSELRRQLHEVIANPALPDRLRSEFSRIAHQTDERSNEAGALEPPTTTDASEEAEALRAPKGFGLVDVWLAILLSWTFALVFVAWLLVVAPLQFVVNLLAGAPARLALASPYRAWSRVTAHEIHVEEDWKSDALPEGAVEAGFTSKPVTFTAVIAAALLFVVSTLIS